MRSSHRRDHQQPHPRPFRGILATGTATLMLVVGVSSCSADEASSPGGSSEESNAPSEAAGEEVLVTRTSIDRVDGEFDQANRARLRARIGGVLDRWIDAAYGGTYPRDDFSAAFESFTARAARRAEKDKALLSNAAVGPEVDDVRTVRRKVGLEVLGVDGGAVAVTAQVDLAFELSGEITRRDAIVGELYLTFAGAGAGNGDSPGWRVFGYDLNRRVK